MHEAMFREALRIEVDAIELPAVGRWLPERAPSVLHMRLRVVALALAIVVILAGGAYALPVLLPSVFQLNDPSAVDVLESGRATELHLTQQAAGITVTLDRAYADAHRVVVQFTITNPPADPSQTVPSPVTAYGSVVLTDASGRVLRVVRGQESPITKDARWSGEPVIALYTFDASTLPANAESESFRLTIPALKGIPAEPGATAKPGATPVIRVTGPWQFDFEIPVTR